MKIDITKIIGYILISPALASVVLFFIPLFGYDDLLSNFGGINGGSLAWFGRTHILESGGAGYTSPLPFYFGLMAIAGVYLIKDKN